MKLLFFIYSLRSGGAERVTTNLANHWAARGWQVTIVTMLPHESDFYELDSRVSRTSIGLATEGGNAAVGFWNNVRRIYRLRQTLKQLQPEVAISMMTSANVLLAIASYRLNNLVKIGSERVFPPSVITARSLWGRLRKWTYGQLTAVAAQTEDAKAWLHSNTFAPHVAVIPNPVEWPLSVHGSRITPRDLGVGGARLLLAAGRLELQKGFDWLIDCFASLSRKHPDWSLVILGEGPQRKSLESQIAARNMETKIFLPGIVGNVGEWYENADLFVLSSRFEGFPNTLLEALAHGLPAVSTDCESGPHDIIRPGIDGLLVKTGDLVALTSALDQLMSSDEMRRRFGECAKDVRERFSMERVASAWESLFGKLKGTELRTNRTGDLRKKSQGQLIPRLGQGGVDATSKKRSRSLLVRSGRGGSFNYQLTGGLNQPPRPLQQMRLRDVFLDVASTPPWPTRGISETPTNDSRP